MKKIILAITVLGLAAASFGQTTTTLKIRELQKEYTETAERVNAGREHLLRLEGAISILHKMENETASRPVINDNPTTGVVNDSVTTGAAGSGKSN